MKQRVGVAEKHLQISKEKYRASHCKFERFEVNCLTPTKDVNVVNTVKFFFIIFSLFIPAVFKVHFISYTYVYKQSKDSCIFWY